MTQNIFLSCPRYCDRGLIVVRVYYFQIWNKKEHTIIINRVISSHMGPMYIDKKELTIIISRAISSYTSPMYIDKKEHTIISSRGISSVTWSTTERREIRNFYYPSVFELTGRQKLTVKREVRNVGQLRPAVEGRKECGSSYLYPVTSPGWKEIVVRTNRQGKEEKRLNDWLKS